ncbi:hypothetical protein QQX10_10990 [Demequina sp. SYSU T00039]|uniref:Uncharacterized protein n=1 Tax=Demequina lignilytica TaxID=3051663 RepID=A0AAW7MA66_9MICO|nr:MULTISPECIES: hypothetical protein [unclassified Demequina]MDN4478713.1 hypothetical protein [Demequina sp. SYSU T00039-1]MDN4488691.1 hypothetical protein [Demequina sp. SYSU T00039]
MGASRDDDVARLQREQPTRRAALAGMLIAGALLVLVAVAALWTRPATVPTYATEAWTGAETVTVRSAVDVGASGPFAACPRIWLADGTRVGALLVDGWAASIPGFAHGERLPTLRATVDGLRVGDGFGEDVTPVEVRVLDLGDPDDAVLAHIWTVACGGAAGVAMVAPDAVLESLALLP